MYVTIPTFGQLFFASVIGMYPTHNDNQTRTCTRAQSPEGVRPTLERLRIWSMFSWLTCSHSAAFGGKTASVISPFASDGLQPALAARDQKIALLEFKLRCTEEESSSIKKALAETVAALQAQPGREDAAAAVAVLSPVAGVPAAAAAASTATSGSSGSSSAGGKGTNSSQPQQQQAAATGALAADEEMAGGGRISDLERRTLNVLVRRYLLARGYKAAAIALAEEVADQDLTGRTDDSSLIAVPGAGKAGGRGGRPVLTLLGIHRQRIASLQAQWAESASRSEGEIASLRAELRAVHEQLEAGAGELAQAKSKVAELEQELLHAKTVRGPANAPAPAATIDAHAAAAIPPPAAQAGGGAGGGGTVVAPSIAGKIVLQHAPALLRSIVGAVPALARITVTKHRAALAPLLAHAAAAEPGAEARRSLVQSFLALIKRPTYAERQLLKVQWGVLAGKLGGGAVEQELLPELLLLAKTGKSKEKRALAAALAGVSAAYVSDKRADTLLACLADLADSKHAVVRVGVVEGLTAVASALAERWQKALAGGVAPGQGSAVEAFALRQYSNIEECMWRVLMGSADSKGLAQSSESSASVGGGADGLSAAEAEELAAANEGEHTLNVPASLALAGTPAGEAAEKALAALAAAAAKKGRGQVYELPAPGSGPAALPGAWFQPPPSVLAGVCASLVPVLVPWAYRLGALWSKVLPGWLALLHETLYTPGPGAPVITPAQGAPAPAVKSTAWHARRCTAVLRVLSSASVRVKQAMLDSGVSITYTGPPDPPEAASAEGYMYELFDNASGAAVTAFPPEVPLAAAQKQGQLVYPAGTTAAQHGAGLLPAQQRQALVLAAILRGTASVRRRRNTHTNPATLAAGTPVWQVLTDKDCTLAWPALQWVMRTLLPTLLHQAACVNRSSGAGRDIMEGYADALCSLGTALGPAFTSYAARPIFLRALGIPCELPPAPPAPGSAALAMPVPGLPQPLVLALQPGVGGRQASCMPLAQILLNVPANPSDARKAAMAAAIGNFSVPPNYASAGPRGGDWPYVLPELAWMSKDSPENPSYAGKTAQALAEMVSKRQAEIAAAPAPTAPGVPSALITERLGGGWNADALLPLFGTGVLACPALADRQHLDLALRALVSLISLNKAGWADKQAGLEDVVLRAGGGGVHTGAPATAPSTSAAAAAAGKDGQAAPVLALDSTAAERASTGAANLSYILGDILPRMAGTGDAAIRTCAAGLLRSVIPLLTPSQIAEPWLPTVKKLAADGSQPGVVRAAVRALATIYSTASANDPEVRGLVNGEVTALLANGPKDIILEVLRSLMRAVPQAPAPTRDGFILDRLLEMTERICTAAEAGSAAMRELAEQLGGSGLDQSDIHSAAASAVRKVRDAAIQESAPWPGCKGEDLEETGMSLCECYRAYGSVVIGPETAAMIRESAARLLKADILDPSYKETMRSMLISMFAPTPSMGGAGGGGHTGGMEAYAGVAGSEGGHEAAMYGEHAQHAGSSLSGTSVDILEQFAAEREAGIVPASLGDAHPGHHQHGASGTLDESFGEAAKALTDTVSGLTSAFKGVSLKGIGGGMSMSGMGMGMGMGSMGMSGLGKGFGLGAAHAHAPAPAQGGKERRHSRAEHGGGEGAEQGGASLSLASFAAAPAPAAAGGSGARRPSGTGSVGAGDSSLNMSAFLAPAPAPSEAPAPAPSGGSKGGLLGSIGRGGSKASGAHGASSTAGGGEGAAAGTKPPAKGGTAKGLGGFGDRLRKMGDAMEKAAEKMMD